MYFFYLYKLFFYLLIIRYFKLAAKIFSDLTLSDYPLSFVMGFGLKFETRFILFVVTYTYIL